MTPDTPSTDPALRPLFELPDEWFQEITDQYETATGLFGTISTLNSEGVVFRARETFGHDHGTDVRDYHRDLIHLSMVEPTIETVSNRAEAVDRDTRAIWSTTDGGSVTYTSDLTGGEMHLPKHVYIHEYVPFESPVETRDDLRTELDEIMDTTPDWEALFDETERVANEMAQG